ncbi:hypothetical protein AKO1_001437, partial [Acrasis kona]
SSPVGRPTLVDTFSNCVVTHISAGYHHSVVVVDSKDVYVCGKNRNGQLGSTEPSLQEFRKINLQVHPRKRVTHISCGSRFTFIVYDARDVYVAGFSSYGALALGEITATTGWTRVLLPWLGPTEQIKFFGCGSNSTTIVTTNNRIYSCGYCNEGECGLPFENSYFNFTQVIHECFSEREIVQIEFGYYHVIVLTNHREVFGYGYNYYGQLCQGDRICQYKPVRIGQDIISSYSPTERLRIYCGGHHTLLVVGNCNLYVAGACMYGQIGLELEPGEEWATELRKVNLDTRFSILDFHCGMYHSFVRCGGRFNTSDSKMFKTLLSCVDKRRFVDVDIAAYT